MELEDLLEREDLPKRIYTKDDLANMANGERREYKRLLGIPGKQNYVRWIDKMARKLPTRKDGIRKVLEHSPPLIGVFEETIEGGHYRPHYLQINGEADFPQTHKGEVYDLVPSITAEGILRVLPKTTIFIKLTYSKGVFYFAYNRTKSEAQE